ERWLCLDTSCAMSYPSLHLVHPSLHLFEQVRHDVRHRGRLLNANGCFHRKPSALEPGQRALQRLIVARGSRSESYKLTSRSSKFLRRFGHILQISWAQRFAVDNSPTPTVTGRGERDLGC